MRKNLVQKIYYKAKMKVQEETPTFAIIEPASVPSYPSEPRTLLIILGSVFFHN